MKKLIAALVGLAIVASSALAASSHFLKVSPSKVPAGKTVTVSGSVGKAATPGIRATLRLSIPRRSRVRPSRTSRASRP